MFRLADDVAVIVENEGDLERNLSVVDKIIKEKYNMKISKQKTKILVSSGNEENRNKLIIGNDVLQEVKECNYLGTKFTSDGQVSLIIHTK